MIFNILILLLFGGRKVSVHEGNVVGEIERQMKDLSGPLFLTEGSAQIYCS
jgi:hypothetical protein